MGAKQSLEDDLMQFKLTSKQFSRDATRSLAKSEQEQKKVAAEMKRGNMAGAQIYAQNAIREKNTYLQFLKLSSQLDGVASKLEYSIRMQKTSATMANTVKGMSSVMKSMDAVKIAQNMEQFSKVFEDMDVASDVMGKTMDSAQSASTPQDEVTMLMRQIGDEAGLDTANLLDAAGGVKQGALLPAKAQAAEVKAPEDDIEQRLAALRR